MISVLLTGFESFDGRNVNQSWRLAEAVQQELSHAPIETLQLPVVFGQSHRPILNWVKSRVEPSLIVSLGEAAISKIQFECLAINKRHTTKPDNQGLIISHQPIESEGPLAYETLWNLDSLIKKMKEMSQPFHLSFSAGTYLCNEVLYRLLELEQTENSKVRVCFVHVPIEQSAQDFLNHVQWLKTFIEVLKGEMHVPTRN